MQLMMVVVAFPHIGPAAITAAGADPLLCGNFDTMTRWSGTDARRMLDRGWSHQTFSTVPGSRELVGAILGHQGEGRLDSETNGEVVRHAGTENGMMDMKVVRNMTLILHLREGRLGNAV